MNSMNDEKSGFGFDTNQISIIKKDFTRKTFPLKSKKEVAEDIMSEIVLCIDEYEESLRLDLYESAYF